MRPSGPRESATGASVGIEVVKPNQPGEGDAAPPTPDPMLRASPFGAAASGNTAPPAADPNELKPNAPADPNELKPADSGADPSLPPPVQVNEIQQGQSTSAETKNADDSDAGQRSGTFQQQEEAEERDWRN